MSAQGATLGRGTVRIPIWPAVVVVLAATAAVIGLSSIVSTDSVAPSRTLVTVTDAQRLANSTAAVREQGGVLPVVWNTSHVAPSLHSTGFAGFENPAATYIRESTGFAGLENPAATYIRESTGFAGLENPAASGAVAWGSIGGPNEALHRQYSPPQDDVAPAPVWGPIMVNGEPCNQCR
jgi:hypothetical protein